MSETLQWMAGGGTLAVVAVRLVVCIYCARRDGRITTRRAEAGR